MRTMAVAGEERADIFLGTRADFKIPERASCHLEIMASFLSIGPVNWYLTQYWL
jgi:hypothetical protein